MKKILAFALCVVMLASMAVFSLPTAAAEAAKAPCGHYNATWTGGNGTDNKVMTCSDCNTTVTFKPSTSLPKGTNAVDGVEAVYLTADVTLERRTPASNDTTYYIDLNGHTVTQTAAAAIFILNTGIKYHLFDSSEAKTGTLTMGAGTKDAINAATATGSGCAVAGCSDQYYGGGYSEFNMYGGTMTGFGGNMRSGGAVTLAGIARDEGVEPDTMVFNMFGGTISNSEAWIGGAFNIGKGTTLNIYGGTVTGCNSYSWGTDSNASAAIMMSKTAKGVNIYGGTFTNNTDKQLANANMFAVPTANLANFKISGGTFDIEPTAEWIQTGYEKIADGNNFVVKKQTKEVVVEGTTHHIATMDNKVDATCTEDGHETDWECLDEGCDYVEKGAVITHKGHSEQVIPKVEPKCEKEGSTEGKKCSVCGEILVAAQPIEALEHVPGEWTVFEAAAMGRSGEERQKCTLCNETLEKREIPALDAAGNSGSANETTSTDAEEKKGCGSVVGGSAVALVAILGFGVTAVSKKKN